MNTQTSFNVLKYGIFSKEDIINSMENQRLVNLPLDIKFQWLDAIKNKYYESVIDPIGLVKIINLIKDLLLNKITDKEYEDFGYALMPSATVLGELQLDFELLNEVIRNYRG